MGEDSEDGTGWRGCRDGMSWKGTQWAIQVGDGYRGWGGICGVSVQFGKGVSKCKRSAALVSEV